MNTKTWTILGVLGAALLGAGCSTASDTSSTSPSTENPQSSRKSGVTVNPSQGAQGASSGEIVVGAKGPGGGVIVYVDPIGFTCGDNLDEQCTYIEVSPASAQVERSWSLDDKNAVGVGASNGQRSPYHAVGAGENNSTIIAKAPGAGGASKNAAIYALDYSTETADDWFLPSIDELLMVYENRALLDGIVGDSYWSSTEGTATDAWGIYFAEGRVSTNFKWRAKTYNVRPIRTG